MAEISNRIIFIVNNLVNIGFPYKKTSGKSSFIRPDASAGF